ncbi:AAA family ATPase [Pseudomonas aeruginosa]|nr:AAA family ATPase [Pseudomonas aeruginosa]
MNYFVAISGCSGGGKSTLLAELKLRGHAVVEEPGRRIIQEEKLTGGNALPWVDQVAFLRRTLAMALDDHARAPRVSGQWVFFDRGIIDAAAALESITGEPILAEVSRLHRYHPYVFMVPPWSEIYVQDTDRRHDMEAARIEFERLRNTYPLVGYEVALLPKSSVEDRADYMLKALTAR